MIRGASGVWQVKISRKIRPNPRFEGPERTMPGRNGPGIVGGCLVPAYSTFFRNWMPFTAISFVVGSMRRQMAAARAITFTSVVKLSITRSPL